MLKRDLNLRPLLTTSAANIDSPIPGDCSPPLKSLKKPYLACARITGVHKFLTLTPPSFLGDIHEADLQEMKPL